MSSSWSPPQAPFHLRRSHRSTRDHSAFGFGGTAAKSSGRHREPDLGLHVPINPFHNRFDVLAEPEPAAAPPAKLAKEFRVAHRQRHVRNSRGAREAKKRRDTRRSGRHNAAHILDEQLSRDIDAIWAEASRQAESTPSLPAPPPVFPATEALKPAPVRLPPAPPRLPMFDFQPFSIWQLPALPTSDEWVVANGNPPVVQTYPLASTTASATLPLVPDWTPQISSLRRNALPPSDFPLLYDLSGLAGWIRSTSRKQTTSRPCTDVRLWQPFPWQTAKKQSRFFPSSTSHDVIPKIPNAACKLHTSDAGAQDMLQVTQQPRTQLTKSHAELFRNVLHAVGAGYIPRSPSRQRHDTAMSDHTAANLWNILASHIADANQQHRQHTTAENLPADFDPHVGTFVANAEPIEASISPLAELGGKEVPYVHANSLTGLCNELASSPYADEHPSVKDSAIDLSPFVDPQSGLNELTVGYDEAEPTVYELDATQVQLPHDADSEEDILDGKCLAWIMQSIPSQIDVAAEFSHSHALNGEGRCLDDHYLEWAAYTHEVASAQDMYSQEVAAAQNAATQTQTIFDSHSSRCAEHDNGEPTLSKSDAHFQSEQDPFEPFPPSSNSTEESHVDIAEFLKLSHAPHCWCGFCEEEQPELISLEELGEDGDWTVCTPTTDSASDRLDEFDEEERLHPGATCLGPTPLWDDVFPCNPTSERWNSIPDGIGGAPGLGFGYDFIDDAGEVRE